MKLPGVTLAVAWSDSRCRLDLRRELISSVADTPGGCPAGASRATDRCGTERDRCARLWGASLEAIAREAAINRPVIYDELLEALIEREERYALGQLEAVVPGTRGEGSPAALLASGVRRFLDRAFRSTRGP